MITVHGGAWLHNDRAVFAPIAAELARRSGFVVVNIEYPRSPAGASLQVRQRAAVEQSVRWVRGHAESLGIDARRVGAVGSSAGGNLLGLVATGGTGSLRSGPRLGAAVAWSGQLDLEHLRGEGATNVVSYLGCDLATCPDTWALASPIDHVNHGDTPMLLFGSRHDSTPPSQATRMAQRAAPRRRRRPRDHPPRLPPRPALRGHRPAPHDRVPAQAPLARLIAVARVSSSCPELLVIRARALSTK